MKKVIIVFAVFGFLFGVFNIVDSKLALTGYVYFNYDTIHRSELWNLPLYYSQLLFLIVLELSKKVIDFRISMNTALMIVLMMSIIVWGIIGFLVGNIAKLFNKFKKKVQ